VVLGWEDAMLDFTRAVLATVCLTAGINASKADEDVSQVKFVPHFIRIHEKGGFFAKTWHEMNSAEFSAFVTAVCTAAMKCGGLDTAALLAIKNTQKLAEGGDFKTSGVIAKQDGEGWDINFPPPPGYTTCSAAYDSKTITANKGDTTNGTVFRNGKADLIATYNVVPKHRLEGHWVGVDFLVKYVKAGTEQDHSCSPDQTTVWRVP
jgi:hypothetical protein